MLPTTFDARLFVGADLAEGAVVTLTAPQAHYLRNVLRLAPGATLALFNGRDGEWLGRIADLAKSGATVRLERQSLAQPPAGDLWLCCAPIKKSHFDNTIEKSTELGVTVLQPVLTRHTVVTRLNYARLRAQAVEAAEQCDRLDVPELRPAVPLDRLLADWPDGRVLLACAEAGPARPIAEVVPPLAGRPVAVLVGPEGGFAKSELDALRDLPFVRAVGLGPRILRADTAALAALACWQALAGDGHSRPFQRDGSN